MSEAAKHAPGPWRVVEYTNNLDQKGVRVVSAVGTVIADDEPYYPCELDPDNASVIAAAPELYEELRTSRCPRPANHRSDEFTVGECVNAGECGCSAGAAVSKAEGRQP